MDGRFQRLLRVVLIVLFQELSHIQPVLDSAKQAVGQIKSDHINEIRWDREGAFYGFSIWGRCLSVLSGPPFPAHVKPRWTFVRVLCHKFDKIEVVFTLLGHIQG